jgi:hypothetical protein
MIVISEDKKYKVIASADHERACIGREDGGA